MHGLLMEGGIPEAMKIPILFGRINYSLTLCTNKLKKKMLLNFLFSIYVLATTLTQMFKHPLSLLILWTGLQILDNIACFNSFLEFGQPRYTLSTHISMTTT